MSNCRTCRESFITRPMGDMKCLCPNHYCRRVGGNIEGMVLNDGKVQPCPDYKKKEGKK